MIFNKKFLFSLIAIMIIQAVSHCAVLIHEVAPGCNGSSTSEFVELYNTGSESVNLADWTLCRRTKTGSSDAGTLTLSGTIPANGYFLITGRDYNNLVGLPINGNANGILFPIGDLHDTGIVVGQFSASAAQIGLKNTSGVLVDAVAYGQLVDGPFAGPYVETTPKLVDGFSSRRSISRDNTTHADLNNNSIDFIYPASDAMPGAMTPTNSSIVEAPPKAWNPNPASPSVNVVLDKTLSWNAGSAAVSHNVNFGTTNPPVFLGNQTAATYNPGALATGTTYYWRIDEVTDTDTITGDIWTFETTGPAQGGYVYLTWKNDPTNSIVVNWWNPNVAGDSTVEYGLTPSYGSQVYNAALSKYHHVELTNLTPGATYHYRVKSSDGFTGDDATFNVPVQNKTSFKFAVYGDTRGVELPGDSTIYHNRHQLLANWMAEKDFEFIIQTGDMANEGSVFTDWVNFFKSEVNLGKSKVVMPAIGNHEVQPSGQSYYYYTDLYSPVMPTNGPAVSNNNGRVYSFNYGNAHFVCLSTSQVSFTTQRDWLAVDLASARQDPNIVWIFVYMHAPLYSVGSHGGDKTALALWGPVIDQYDVDFVIASHNHLYDRSYPITAGQIVPDGTYYITNGCGGAPFSNHLADSPDLTYTAIWHEQETLVTCFTINGNELTMETISNTTNLVKDMIYLAKEPDYDIADFNHDGWVDAKDLSELTEEWLDDGMWP